MPGCRRRLSLGCKTWPAAVSLYEALATGRQVNAACNRNTLRAALHEAPTVRALADFASGREYPNRLATAARIAMPMEPQSRRSVCVREADL